MNKIDQEWPHEPIPPVRSEKTCKPDSHRFRAEKMYFDKAGNAFLPCSNCSVAKLISLAGPDGSATN